MYISVVEKSGDAKLSARGNVSATWVPQQSCHEDCPLKRNGCYAEEGRSGLHTWKMNRRAQAAKKGLAHLRKLLAQQEAKAIRGLTGLRKLRVHVVGDCATAYAARLVGRAMVAHGKKHGKPAWTYTHSWRAIPKAAWSGANVWASCERPEQVAEARARGYAAALIVPPHPTNKVYEFGGQKVIPCPAQFVKDGKRTVTCEFCNICQRPDELSAEGFVVGFAPDGVTTKRVLKVIGG